MAAPRPRLLLRILCFGDSLTAGYSALGAVHHPYHGRMEQMLAMAFPHVRVETEGDGASGETVTRGGFRRRMRERFPPPSADSKTRKKDDGNPYDWVIVLGGTNDIGLGVPPDMIFEELAECWDIPLRRGCKVLALTVPEAGITGLARERIDARRNELNDAIRGYKRENFHVFDLNTAVTYYSMSEADRTRYWDDHLHFTPDGYDLVGNKVGVALVSILAKDRTLNPPVRRRLRFRDDGNKFDEETGDPTAIDQGYVVVRRTDLD